MIFWEYFPLNLKNFWIYKTSEKFSDEYSFIKVLINEKIPLQNKVIYVFTYYLDDEEIKKESFIIQEDGIFLYARKIDNNLVVFDPLLPFLPYNFPDVEWWSWEGKVGALNSKIIFKNKKFVDNDTVKIVYEEENKLGKSVYELSIKRNVGIVKEEAETPFIGYSSELTDFQVSFDDFSFINFKESNEDYKDLDFQEFSYEQEFNNEFNNEFYDNQDINIDDDFGSEFIEIEEIEENEEINLNDKDFYKDFYDEDLEDKDR